MYNEVSSFNEKLTQISQIKSLCIGDIFKLLEISFIFSCQAENSFYVLPLTLNDNPWLIFEGIKNVGIISF